MIIIPVLRLDKNVNCDITEILMKDALITMVLNESKPIILPPLYGKYKALGNNLSITAFLHI
jgi:hypothetical protein